MSNTGLRVVAQLMKKASLMGAFFIGLLGCIPVQASCPLPGKLPTYRVERVVDGDTLRLTDGRSVRLIGLNTPELAHQGRPPQPYAQQAQRRLQQLVSANDERVALQIGVPAQDHYGRTLAHAYDRQGRNLEQLLLADGLGYQVAFAPETVLVDCQRAAERQARQAARGLWQQPDILMPDQLRAGGFALIRGKVLWVERNRGGLWLEMGSTLVLQVRPKLFSRFDIQALEKLTGRDVEVRGWVVDRSRRNQTGSGQARWLLSLTSPFMLEVLQ